MNRLKATMRVAQVSRPGGPLELVERPIPDPGPGSVRIKVQACGICHSDAMTKEGAAFSQRFCGGSSQRHTPSPLALLDAGRKEFFST